MKQNNTADYRGSPTHHEGGDPLQHHTPSEKPKRIALGSKRAAVLAELLNKGKRGLNCFDAVRLCHDYVLRSTISELAKEHGFEFPRKPEVVPGYGGKPTDCTRYWLSEHDEVLARELLGWPAKAAA